MYNSEHDDEFYQGNFELQPHERISEVWAEDFQRYFDRWIKYWPKNVSSGYYQKLAYNSPFFQPKSKKNPDNNRHLYGDFLLEQVERHLDPQHWKDRKEAKQFVPVSHTQFWLGLKMPRITNVSCIDPDAKQYILGYYRIGDTDPLRPVVHLPLEHFQLLKLIYDHFPGRIWCISSATLGMHVWLKHSKPMIATTVHKNTKEELGRIGLGKIEVHPMPGRCLRRPFGKDYATITKEGLLTTWQSQTTFFEFVAETPPFELIARTLLTKVQEQWRLWSACGDALKKANPRKMIAQYQHEIEEVEQWIEQGCPSSPPMTAQNNEMSRWIDAGCQPRQQQRSITVAPEYAEVLSRWIDAVGHDDTIPYPASSTPAAITSLEAVPHSGKVIYSLSERSKLTDSGDVFELEALRNGNWVNGLREIVINGLPGPKSLHSVCYELTKWLYWVELYKQPDSEKVIYRLLLTFVADKHNGYCQRITDGKIESVEQDVRNAINSAIKLDPTCRMKSLDLFARLRQKRDQGEYKQVINLVPILEGNNTTSSLSFSSLLICISTLEAVLPKELQERIAKKAGRNKVMTFATRLINLLHQRSGSCRLHQSKLAELLGYNNQNQVAKYVNILIAAKIITKSSFYQKGKQSKLHTLSKDAIDILNEARIVTEVVA